jgi:hypothetical protein
MQPYPLETAIFPVGVSLTRPRITRRDMTSAVPRCVVGPKSQIRRLLLGITNSWPLKVTEDSFSNLQLYFLVLPKVKTIRIEPGLLLTQRLWPFVESEGGTFLLQASDSSLKNIRLEPRHSTPEPRILVALVH